MANVKIFADKQTDKRTGQKLYAPDLSMWGHKKDEGRSRELLVNRDPGLCFFENC